MIYLAEAADSQGRVMSVLLLLGALVLLFIIWPKGK